MRTFNEDTRVKIPATIQFLRLGYNYLSFNDEDTSINFKTKIFINRFKPALERINNRKFSDDEISKILTDINTLIEYDDLGEAFYNWLIKPRDGIKLIDFDNIDNNDFAVIDELSFSVIEGTDEGSFRPDVNVLINGIPLAFLEVKPPNNEGGIRKEFNRMIDVRLQNPHYKKYFNMIQVVSFSNNMEYEKDTDAYDVKAGSFYTTLNGYKTSFSFFREEEPQYFEKYRYKKIDEEKVKNVLSDCGYSKTTYGDLAFQTNLKENTPCNRFITSLFDKERFMFLLHYGIMFLNGKNREKHIMRYPQFFATRNIITRLGQENKNGIIWHTQGSGKTDLAAYANRAIADYYSKQGITARFYFIVDRLYLLNQACLKFASMRFSVARCKNKEAFGKELRNELPTNLTGDSRSEFCVVNIQKIEEDIPQTDNKYGVNVQRIFFVDEAHRSYSNSAGEFFKNLMLCDDNGIYIALTGTPLLAKKSRTTYRFGNYIDKYFYDKSIADGYTLKIKKEPVDTSAFTYIKENLRIEENRVTDESVFDSPSFRDELCLFIEKDFRDFMLTYGDKTVGGMIVCKGNEQAKDIYDWFKRHSSLTVGLVLSDATNKDQEKMNDKFQNEFRQPPDPEHPINLLIVNFMLTTGYDVKRLKKLYLLRGAHKQSLLQTISRVNRPYIAPNGTRYKYGYLVDFADIDSEYNRTLTSYTKELENDYNMDSDEKFSLVGLVEDVEAIHEEYLKCLDNLQEIVPVCDNLEDFSSSLSNIKKSDLYQLRRLLNTIKECEVEFELSKSDYAKEIDITKYNKLLSLTQKRISFLNLKDNPLSTINLLSNEDIVQIVYQFKKGKPSILDLGTFIEDDFESEEIVEKIRNIRDSYANNKNKDDPRILNLDERLNEIFNKLSISSDMNIEDSLVELNEVLDRINGINKENDDLASRYGGQYAFVKSYQDALDKYQLDEDDLERVMDLVYELLADSLKNGVVLMLSRSKFVKSIKHGLTPKLLDEDYELYDKIRPNYDQFLEDIYKNLMIMTDDTN